MSFTRALLTVVSWFSVWVGAAALCSLPFSGDLPYPGTWFLCTLPVIGSGIVGAAYLYWLTEQEPRP